MPRTEENPAQTPPTGNLGCLVRLAWLLVGHGVIMFALMLTFESKRTGFGAADAVVWGAVVACIVFRYLDVSRLSGLTTTGRPASIADWRRYTLILVVATLVLWGIARKAAFVGMVWSEAGSASPVGS
jgi:hypothetical protein